MALNYTFDQRRALEMMKEWVYIPYADAPVFRLKGAAGTGKTTIMRELISFLQAERLEFEVTAPTHKARLVLSEKINLPTITLQSALGFAPDIDLEKNGVTKKFKPKFMPKISGLDVLLIDEASMIGEEIYMFLRRLCREEGCKILFLGDIFQLPPVKESTPIALLDNPDANEYELKEIVRQAADSPLSLPLLALRCDISCLNNNGYVDQIILTDLYQSVEAHAPVLMRRLPQVIASATVTHLILSGEIQNDAMVMLNNSKEFAPIYKDNPDIKMLLFKNDSVDLYNKAARKLLGYEGLINAGEILMSYRTIVIEEEPIITNGLEYRVNAVDGPFEYAGMNYLSLRITPLMANAYDARIRIIPREHISNIFIKLLPLITEALQTRKWEKIADFQKEWLITYDLQKEYAGKQMPPGFSVMKNYYLPPISLKYGYAMTIHKSQGSTYNEVMVDLNDIPFNHKGTNAQLFALQLLYVALSRASDKVYLIKRNATDTTN